MAVNFYPTYICSIGVSPTIASVARKYYLEIDPNYHTWIIERGSDYNYIFRFTSLELLTEFKLRWL